MALSVDVSDPLPSGPNNVPANAVLPFEASAYVSRVILPVVVLFDPEIS